MEEHTIIHIRTVLLVTLSIMVAIILYYRLLKYFQKNMDKKPYAVLLPFEYREDKLLISIEIPNRTEVSLDVLDNEENSLRSLLKGDQEVGRVKVELDPKDLPENALFLRMSSEGQNVLRRLKG